MKMRQEKIPNWARLCGVLGVVAVLAVYGVVGRMFTPAARAQRALELGEKYLLSGEYEQAVIQFTNVIDIARQAPDLSYLVQEGQTRLETAARSGAVAAVQQPGGDLQDAVTWLEEVDCADLDSVTVFRDVRDLLAELQALCEEEAYDQVFTRLSDESYKDQVAELLGLECYARLYSDDTGLMTAIYAMEQPTENFEDGPEVNYMVYYGGHAPDETWQETDGTPRPELRSGDAVWLAYRDGNNYLARGPWEKDRPNGEFETRSWQQTLNSAVTYRVILGQVTDGLWDGQVTWRFETGDAATDYHPTFTAGQWQIMTVDENGYAVADRNDQGDLIVRNPDATVGIVGYAQAA